MNKNSNKGFTLIEVLAVITIIGVLSAFVFSGAAASRKSGRVAQRVSDMKRVQNALELYYAQNKSYPSTGGSGSWRSTCPLWGGHAGNNVIMDVNNNNRLVPTYLPAMPNDPQTAPGSNNNCYLYTSNGSDYAFLNHWVTDFSDGSSGATYLKHPELVDPARDGGSNANIVDGTNIWSWKVSSPGAIAW